jgi:hypothetical protein
MKEEKKKPQIEQIAKFGEKLDIPVVSAKKCGSFIRLSAVPISTLEFH